ncbi:uncharacterized protein E0L32_000887 [Thyridium curvatum]|uniref:AAA+ ATPase domain-containing protein n=1 Tax=Thyridium curvatum TaxID=1093900 RepID=A0A507B7V0_9PEZI|nr:uncharacterized protein E0L32_000887 [Thyridium curvatum]TPX12710.1 hypothetical protein E0L32_000887 [Thyridium curvatum]
MTQDSPHDGPKGHIDPTSQSLTTDASPRLDDPAPKEIAADAAINPTLPSTEGQLNDGEIPHSCQAENPGCSSGEEIGNAQIPNHPNEADESQVSEYGEINQSNAALYCQKSGRLHVSFIGIGILDCPYCQQSLRAPKTPNDGPSDLDNTLRHFKTDMRVYFRTTDDDNSREEEVKRFGVHSSGHLRTSEEDSDSDSEKESTEQEGEKDASTEPLVSHLVEYRDERDRVVLISPCAADFDLAEARKATGAMSGSIFDVITVIDTSLSRSEFRYDYPYSESDILNNPKLTLKVRLKQLVIHSHMIIAAVRRAVRYYPSQKFNTEDLVIEEPYMLLQHHVEELKSIRELSEQGLGVEPRNAEQELKFQESQHLAALLNFLQKSSATDIEEERERHKRGMCTFRMLWLLFKPGTTVYADICGTLSAYVVRKFKIFRGGYSKEYNISIWNLVYDGKYVGRSKSMVTIAQFEGERQIQSMKVFPSEFHDREDGGRLRQQLETNGESWFSLIRGAQVYYEGPLLGSARRHFKGRAYVDNAAYFNLDYGVGEELDVRDYGKEMSKCQCEQCHGRRPHPPPDFPWARYDLIDPETENNLVLANSPEGPRHRYMLCSPILWGFDLKAREWKELDVNCCREPKINADIIDTLVMPPDRKEMIKALVYKFADSGSPKKPSQPWGADFIENKGEGQIFLLHGGPGVGKTYTAECIAEFTGRPLLSLTCADIGTDEGVMEQKLSKWFTLAERWGAVMLIDEADVYLERRQISDLIRNSLVSVFLRCIEYYRGILFLTTNRVGHFDDAFMSRIHVIIAYDNLQAEERATIWRQFFDKLEEDRTDFVITSRAKEYVLHDEAITKLELNGREIRNAFQTAVALAEYRFAQRQHHARDHPRLDQKDFEQVCAMMQQFKQYLDNVHGANEDGRAFKSRARAYPDDVHDANPGSSLTHHPAQTRSDVHHPTRPMGNY